MSIQGIKEWDSGGFENSSKIFIMDISEHLSRVEVKVMIMLRNV